MHVIVVVRSCASFGPFGRSCALAFGFGLGRWCIFEHRYEWREPRAEHENMVGTYTAASPFSWQLPSSPRRASQTPGLPRPDMDVHRVSNPLRERPQTQKNNEHHPPTQTHSTRYPACSPTAACSKSLQNIQTRPPHAACPGSTANLR